MKDEAVGVQTSKGFHVDPIAESQLFELDLFFELVLLQFKKKHLNHETWGSYITHLESDPIEVTFTVYSPSRDAKVVLGHKYLSKISD